MKMGILVNGVQVIQKHANDVQEDFGKSLKIALFLQKVAPIVQEWEKSREAIFKKYGEEVEKDGEKQLAISRDNMPAFAEAMNEINNTEVDIEPNFEQKDFASFKNGTISESLALAGLIKTKK